VEREDRAILKQTILSLFDERNVEIPLGGEFEYLGGKGRINLS
jgi:hypothetical protein